MSEGNPNEYRKRVWHLVCACGHKFEKSGMVLNPTCPQCSKQAKVTNRTFEIRGK